MEVHHGEEARKYQMFETFHLEPLKDVYLTTNYAGPSKC
jgi:hypothetical protein